MTFATDFVNKWSSIYVPVSSSYKQFKIPQDVIGVKFSQNGNDGKRHTIYVDDIEFLPANYQMHLLLQNLRCLTVKAMQNM